jgi:hypothetical protein
VCVRKANESSRLCLLDVAMHSFLSHFHRGDKTISFAHIILSVDKDDDDIHREFGVSSARAWSILLEELRKSVR